MKKHFIHTIISVMVFWGVYSPAVALSAEDNQAFLEMINVIRKAPYEYAKGLEYTHEDLIAKGIDSDTRFNPYTIDEGLTATAEDESQMMAGEKISESEETAPLVYRFAASTGGVVSFFNFMPRDTAFKIVIDYLFKNELDNNTFDYILSEKYSSAGIAISAGKVGSGNAWFVAICLRSSELVSEIQMLNLINQVRANPNNIWEYTQLNKAEAITLNPNFLDLIYSDYKPLFFNASLSASARAHLSETQTDLELDANYGYEGEVVQEHGVEILSVSGESGPSVDSLFVSLIYKELIAWPLSYVAFLKDFQDVGYSKDFQIGDNYNVSVLSFVVGKNDPNINDDENSSIINDDETSRIYGVLFSDDDGDDLYAPGEELRQQIVTVSVYADDVGEMRELKTVRTDNAGHFSMELESNRQYSFTATIGEDQVKEEGVFITSDQFVKLVYSPPSLENNLLTGDLQ